MTVIVAGVAATLEWVNTDAEGSQVAPAGTVTVGVTRDGTTVKAAGTATSTVTGETGKRTVALTAAETALGTYTATWTDAGDSSVHTTTVECWGGHLATIPDIRDLTSIGDSKTVAEIVAARLEATEEAEWICDRAFTRRKKIISTIGSGDRALIIPANDLVSVSAVTIDGTALTSTELTELVLDEHRTINRAVGDVWPADSEISITVTYGLLQPPAQVKRALLTRIRMLLNQPNSGVHPRATRVTVDQAGTFELDQASRFKTGVPDVDAAYSRFSLRTSDEGSAVAYSRTLDLDPQWGSLFHGGRR